MSKGKYTNYNKIKECKKEKKYCYNYYYYSYCCLKYCLKYYAE